jgi:hypothetical protein
LIAALVRACRVSVIDDASNYVCVLSDARRRRVSFCHQMSDIAGLALTLVLGIRLQQAGDWDNFDLVSNIACVRTLATFVYANSYPDVTTYTQSRPAILSICNTALNANY